MTDDTLLCITHYIDDVRPCTVRNIHYAACEYPDTCTGCVPREAKHGHICSSCWHRLEKATSTWEFDFLPKLAKEVRAVQPEPGNGRSKPGSSVPLSPLQLAIDAILRLERSRPGALRLWPTTPAGAENAVRFTREVERAILAFPTAETISKIPTTRCPTCGRRTLVYEPADHLGADATVRCLSTDCNNVMDHTSFERIALIEAQCCRRCRHDDGCTNTDCTCHRLHPVPEWQRTNKPSVEQPFTPNSPEHADLDILTTVTVAEIRRTAIEMELPHARQMRKPELIAAIRETQTMETQ